MRMLDNRAGFGAVIGKGGYNEKVIELNDNKVYGEVEIPDCPENGGYCNNYAKYGL